MAGEESKHLASEGQVVRGDRAAIVLPDGTTATINVADLPEFIGKWGARLQTPEEQQGLFRAHEFGGLGGQLKAAGEGFASAASLGLVPAIIRAADPELAYRMGQRAQQNPLTHLGTEVAGAFTPVGPAHWAAEAGQAIKGLGAEAGLLGKTLAGAGGEAVTGSLIGFGQGLENVSQAERPLSVDAVFSELGTNALFGGGIGGGIGALGALTHAAGREAQAMLKARIRAGEEVGAASALEQGQTQQFIGPKPAPGTMDLDFGPGEQVAPVQGFEVQGPAPARPALSAPGGPLPPGDFFAVDAAARGRMPESVAEPYEGPEANVKRLREIFVGNKEQELSQLDEAIGNSSGEDKVKLQAQREQVNKELIDLRRGLGSSESAEAGTAPGREGRAAPAPEAAPAEAAPEPMATTRPGTEVIGRAEKKLADIDAEIAARAEGTGFKTEQLVRNVQEAEARAELIRLQYGEDHPQFLARYLKEQEKIGQAQKILDDHLSLKHVPEDLIAKQAKAEAELRELQGNASENVQQPLPAGGTLPGKANIGQAAPDADAFADTIKIPRAEPIPGPGGRPSELPFVGKNVVFDLQNHVPLAKPDMAEAAGAIPKAAGGGVAGKAGEFVLAGLLNRAMHKVAGAALGPFGAGWMAYRLAHGAVKALKGALGDSEGRLLQRVDSGVNKFMKASTGGGRAITAAVTSMKNLSFGPTPAQSKVASVPDTQALAAAKQRMDEVRYAQANIDATRETLRRNMAGIMHVDAKLADSIMERAEQALGFLATKLPPAAPLGSIADGFNRQQPSDFEVRKWAEYAATISNPARFLDLLSSGRVTHEAVEALQVAAPALLAKVQERIMTQVVEKQKPLSYDKRLQISQIFNVPADSTMRPDAISAFQTTFLPANKAQTKTMSAGKGGKMTPPEVTSAQMQAAK